MKIRLALLAAFALVVVVTLAACGGTTDTGGSGDGASSGTGPAGSTIVEQNLAFDPPTLEVTVGTPVTWENLDSVPHNIKIDGKELGTQEAGAFVTWTPEKTGTYPYSCTIHPSMTGEIVVK